MSQYPGYPWPYGQYHGHPVPPPPPPTQSPYGYQTPTAYPAPPFPPPPTYGAPGAFPPPPAHQTAAQGSFNYNASNIPGLGMGANGPVGTAFPGAPAPSPWGQPMPASFTPTIPNSHSTQPSVATSAKPPQSVVAAAQVAVSIEMEEGELSEGQFEDLYDDTQKSPPPASPPKQTAKQLSVAQPSTDPNAVHSQPTSASDTPEGGFYGNEEEEGEVGSKGDDAISRDRSASYSPFLSPREGSHEEPTLEAEGPGPLNASQPQPNNTSQTAPPVQNVGSPGLQSQSSAALDANDTSKRPTNYLEAFKTVPEVKKEAQKAILRLWALGVKYQTYLDEGFDENVIRSLFGDLHLELPKPIVEKTKAEAQTAPSPGAGSDSPITGQPQGTQSESQGTTTEKSKGEERKDRIARLLAAKAAKGPAVVPPKPAVVPTNPAPAEVSKPVPPTGPKAKTRGEKERILQEKIAALQKAREAQASAAGKSGSQTPINNATTTSALQPPSGPSSMTLNLVGPKPGALPIQTGSLPTPPIPGLLTSPNIQLNTASQRKRPVAADFVDYPSATGSTKRPFGQLRQEASLIIDVSDVSDDEEMDMDMGSPIDEPSSIQARDGLTSTRGLSIRDFPPLTNTLPQRQLSAPTTPSHTPPTGPAIGGKRHTELTIKEREIQEMRRMIAQAEAKRKAKMLPAGSQAQTQVGEAPEPKNTGGLVLSSPARSDRPTPQATPEATSVNKASQLATLNPSQKTGPRGRLAALEEKRKRLERLRAEEALLQAEIEKEMMAAQLEQVNTPSDQSTPQDSGQNSGNDSTEVRSTTQAVASANAEGLPTSATVLAPDNKQVDDATSAGEIRTSGEPSQTGIPLEQSVEPQPVEPQQTLGSDAPSSGGSQYASSSDSEQAQKAMSVDGGEPDSRQSADISLPNNNPDVQVNDETATAANLEAEVPSTDQDVDETTPMELDSEAPSPTTAESILSGVLDSDVNDADHLSVSLPDQISSTTQSREAVQEAEAEATPEGPRKSSEKPDGAFMPYKSPLQIFRAYRFHPDFDKTVPGGLKSMTYSGRVDTKKPLCPYELNNSQCPENCEFQHFKAIKTLDDQILVELGKSDFTGEQRDRFNQGLRELLQVYKAQKVRDFDVIARGIIKFRFEFLGDRSKVLSLDGVSI
ncbi:hypothetical protein QBC40DRAFT_11455 [Triangularia verruculosa]|uniref:Putative zinc-finger domain-containing protein n=1 Tax=Triangularia verruculosa TaxID=2587418 RepID=A0AAN6XB82_9PEZI|nr:hypothetical protein QBC40DRAFT_11455 [Triangularia verruculosa]